MSQMQFSYSISTSLSREGVWALFADIDNWRKFSNVYNNLRWSGAPWQRGSWICGTLQFPHSMPLRYVLETCHPGSIISYKAYSIAAGFATHRVVKFKQQQGQTLINVDSYLVGTPTFAIAGGGYEFLRMLVENWFSDFAAFCDNHVEAHREHIYRDAVYV